MGVTIEKTDLYTKAEVCKIIGRSVSTVNRLIRAKKLPNSIMFKGELIIKYLEKK